MREQLAERPDPRLEADLVAALAATARSRHVGDATAAAPRKPRSFAGLRRAALPARIALAALGLVLSMAGLAVAGVELPAAVDSGFKTVGVDLPNQPAGEQDRGGTPAAAPTVEPADDGRGPVPGAGRKAGDGQKAGRRASGKPSGAPGHPKANRRPQPVSPGKPGDLRNPPGQAGAHVPKAAPTLHSQGRAGAPKPPRPVPTPKAHGKGS
jgi:hypothetical protein